MREIKFRYRYEQTSLSGTKQVVVRYYNLDDIAEYAKPKARERILSRDEYTGIKDKNGKEIYEGDIVSKGEYLAVIVWDNEHSEYHAKDAKENSYYGINLNWVVISNIYENPELLGGK